VTHSVKRAHVREAGKHTVSFNLNIVQVDALKVTCAPMSKDIGVIMQVSKRGTGAPATDHLP